MSAKTENESEKNFLETYIYDISPKLKEIDLYLKLNEGDFSREEVSAILHISENEILEIMDSKKIDSLNKFNFFKIMEYGSSEICKLYKREIEVGSPYVYTKKDIAYIYDIDLEIINKTCDLLNIKEVTAYTIPILFSNINTNKSTA